jgi:hypothetical protein
LRLALCMILLSAAILQVVCAGEPSGFRTKFDRDVIEPQALICRSVDQAPVIDGEVDKDPVWPSCDRTRGAWVNLGSKNASGRQTVVYVCYDQKNLYLGFVCDESELQNSRFDGNVGQNIRLGTDDCVEAVIEIGGQLGEGQVYSFRANPRTRTAGWGYSNISTREGAYTPEWKSAGKLGSNRWMVEMEIPFASLKTKKHESGMALPLCGDVLGIKLARYGSEQADPKTRLASTWNAEIPVHLLYVCGHNRLLYFGGANVLENANFSEAGSSAWKKNGDVKAVAAGGLNLSAGATVSQTMRLRPREFYLLHVDGEDAIEAYAGDQKIELSKNSGGFFAPKDAVKCELTLKATAPAKLREISLQLQPGEEQPGIWCLTNNYRRRDRNICNLDTKAPEGSYRYVRTDYNGVVIGEDHPSATKRPASWASNPDLAIPDIGGEEGYIPFSKGSLTGSPQVAFWQTEFNVDYAGWGRHKYFVIDVDLGQEYFVRGLDVLLPAPYLLNMEVWCKPEGSNEWTYLFAADGQFVNPATRKGYPRGFEKVRGLDSVARHIRFGVTSLHPAYPQMDGVQEFWVWGEPRGKRTSADVKLFQAWHDPKTTPAIKAYTDAANLDDCMIVPQPQQMQLDKGWFLLNAQTNLVVQDHPEARKVARQIQEEVRERWQVELKIRSEADDSPLENCIYLGVAEYSDLARQAAKHSELAIESDRPQGYVLRASPNSCVILGRDAEGLYYGVQSLMMAMRWHESVDLKSNAPGVRCMRIRDWPGTRERGIYHRRAYMPMLAMPESEIDRIKRLVRLLSRFKYNVAYQQGDLEGNPELRKWSAGRFRALCREMKEEYHVEFRPAFLYEEGEGGGYWQRLPGVSDTARESNPDEAANELGGLLNLCPLNPETYSKQFEKIDRVLEAFDCPGKVWLFGQVYHGQQNGARWNACRTCQKSGKNSEELYKLFLFRLAEHFQSRNTKAILRSPWLRFGQKGSGDSRLISMDANEVPPGFTVDLDENTHMPQFCRTPGTAEAIAGGTLNAELTANGPWNWPSSERYFHAPQTESEILHSFAGQSVTALGNSINASLAHEIDKMWHAPHAPPWELNAAALRLYVVSWWFGAEYPSGRAGVRPDFFPIDLRKFANHTSAATGEETLQPGRLPEIDLRYLPKGTATLADVTFDIIDPEKNGGKGLLMLGRPPENILPEVGATISENTAPIPVDRKAASLSFLRTQWMACTHGMYFVQQWLRPVCRVVFDDGQWLVVDSFQWMRGGAGSDSDPGFDLYYRRGWYGNTPKGALVKLRVVEWINAYPEKVISHLEYVTPDFRTTTGKRINNLCEAVIAISGAVPTERDIAFWTKTRAAERTPLLPQIKQRDSKAVELTRLSRTGIQRDGSWKVDLQLPVGKASCKITPQTNTTGRINPLDLYEEVYCDAGFVPFGATQLFESPVTLRRVEVRGPWFIGDEWWGCYSARTRKLDVNVEYSEDGTQWVKAGALRGIGIEADFLPIDLPNRPIKGLRFIADAKSYRYHYHPVMVGGGILTPLVGCSPARFSPHFCWRLFTAARE